MVASSLFRPGIVTGFYPEKDFPKSGLLDTLWDRVGHFSKRCFKYNQRTLQSVVNAINRFDGELRELDEHALSKRIKQLKSRLVVQGLEDQFVVESFALIREVTARKLNMRHYDVQLIGGWIIFKGLVAEMETGEGKTLMATLPACTAAMAGIPVHIVTVNDYLVERDAMLMGPIYKAFGLTVGTITEGMDRSARQSAYACDITYCSNKQLTFDYLKDKLVFGRKGSRLNLQLGRLDANQAIKHSALHLRGLCFAIVDEADSVLIDESRTPLILSREAESSLDQLHVYQQALTIAGQLKEIRDFFIDYRYRNIDLTESGIERIKQQSQTLTGIWSAEKRSRELVLQALSALFFFQKDVNYLVKDGKVVIIDEYTGRVMPDRSWERGLHQLIEVKEGCPMSGQKETLCRISYQSFFRRYLMLAGMTGTAKEVAGELFSVYRQSVIKIPTHKPSRRIKLPTRFFMTAHQKWLAIVERIEEIHQQGRPVLVGTRSVEASEHLGRLLADKGLQHRILNARQDVQEAEIIKSAGAWRSITLATNMAGRGTDIHLAEGVDEMGGLHVIATERHEARRIDRQLFGRCGRQGNAGSYEMFLSFDDEIASKFVPWHVLAFVKVYNDRSMPAHRLLTAALFDWAQKRAERHHAMIRKNLLKMDENLQNLLAFSGKPE